MSKKVTELLQENKGNWFEDNVVSNAPIIMAVFANLMVVIADIRVYDVVYRITGIWWQAISASLACAVPFIIWEISWQYNHTTDNWRTTSLFMAGLAFVTSIVLGVADFVGITSGIWSDIMLGGVVILTGVHTVVGLLYYYNDPDVARKRRKSQALGKMLDNELNAQVAGALLEQGNTLLGIVESLEKRYSPEDVEGILNLLSGRKQDKPSAQPQQKQQQRPQQVMSMNSDTGNNLQLKDAPRQSNPPQAGEKS